MRTHAEDETSAQRAGFVARDPLDVVIMLAFAGALAASVLVFVSTASQPILEWFGFRQAQTALTAYWFIREGFALAYQTPVVGHPWAIPLELPLFQALVALIASFTKYPLDTVGRGVSFAFFLAMLIPAASICRDLRLGRRVFFIFGSLYLVSPQYLFWARTFMIESLATFLTVSAIAAALPLLRTDKLPLARVAAIVLLASLAMTVKITTALPALAVLGTCIILSAARHWRQRDASSARRFVLRAAVLVPPVIVALLWTYYTDAIKVQNDLGKLLTSTALMRWNFGWAAQRVHSLLYTDVIWARSFVTNAAGVLGVVVMVLFFWKEPRQSRRAVGACLVALFLLPVLTFTNLHYIHHYYQTANIIYLVFLLALGLAFVSERISARGFTIVFAAALLSNVFQFHHDGWARARAPITAETNRVLAVAGVLREHAPPDKPILVYGLDWSSELAYYAERKALSMPEMFGAYEDPLLTPQHYFGTSEVGALVICPAARSPRHDLVEGFLRSQGRFNEMGAYGCRVFVSA